MRERCLDVWRDGIAVVCLCFLAPADTNVTLSHQHGSVMSSHKDGQFSADSVHVYLEQHTPSQDGQLDL